MVPRLQLLLMCADHVCCDVRQTAYITLIKNCNPGSIVISALTYHIRSIQIKVIPIIFVSFLSILLPHVCKGYLLCFC